MENLLNDALHSMIHLKTHWTGCTEHGGGRDGDRVIATYRVGWFMRNLLNDALHSKIHFKIYWTGCMEQGGDQDISPYRFMRYRLNDALYGMIHL